MRLRDWNSNLKIRLIAETFVGLATWMSLPFLTVYFTSYFGAGLAGLLLSIATVVTVIFGFFGGHFADKYGRKRMMSLSSLLQSGALVVLALSCGRWWGNLPVLAFIGFVLNSVFNSFYYPASQAMVVDVTKEEDRTYVFSVFYTANNLTVVIGPLIGSFFFTYYRFELFAITACILLTIGIILSIYLKETAPQAPCTCEEGEEKWYTSIVEQIKSYKVILTDKIFFLFILAGIILAQSFMQLDMLIPVYVNQLVKHAVTIATPFQTLHLDANNIIGGLVSENGLIVILFAILVSKIVTKYKEQNVFILSALLYGISMLYIGLTSSVLNLFIAVAIFTAGEVVSVGIQMNFVSRIAPEHLRGKYFAASSLRWTVGRAIAPIFIIVAGQFGFRATFIFISLLAGVSAYLYYVTYQKAERISK